VYNGLIVYNSNQAIHSGFAQMRMELVRYFRF
jgi:hypothetical protein